MLDELNTIKFEENLTKQADLTPMYQITKVANDTYQVYSFENRSAEIINSKAALKTVASLRGGSYLSPELTKAVTGLGNFSSVIITADALSLSKKASVATDSEPWKLVTVNDVEYFVKVEADTDEDNVQKEASSEAALTKTASVKPHNYTVKVNAHNIAEIAKIAGFAEELLGAQPDSFSTNPDTNTIVFVVASPEDGCSVQAEMLKKLEQGNIILPNSSVVVADESGALHQGGCPCCQHMQYKRPHDGMFCMKPAGSPKEYYADKEQTLKEFADGHFTDYTITASPQTGAYPYEGSGEANTALDHSNSAEHEKDFAHILASFLYKSAENGFEKTAAAEGYVCDKETGDLIKDDDPNIAANPERYTAKPSMVTQGADDGAAQQPAEQMPTQQQGEASRVVDPAEKPADETKQKGDNEVKRWKGMREDPSTGKYVVYITETEEHIYDNANDAINFLVRK